jgi:hypothetical protein
VTRGSGSAHRRTSPPIRPSPGKSIRPPA